jgi:hypothetical protein
MLNLLLMWYINTSDASLVAIVVKEHREMLLLHLCCGKRTLRDATPASLAAVVVKEH